MGAGRRDAQTNPGGQSGAAVQLSMIEKDPNVADRLVNPVKEKLRAGEVVLGITVRTSRTPDIARIAKATGHDFIFIDGQHSIFNLESTISIAHAALGIGMTCLVRVRGVDDPNASLLL